MKHITFLLTYCFSFFHIICHTEPVARTLLISLHKDPVHQKKTSRQKVQKYQKTDAHQKIQKSIDQLNIDLAKSGKIMPPEHMMQYNNDTFFSSLFSFLYYWYCLLVFPRYSFAHPEKENKAFIHHALEDLGVYTIYIPDGVAQHHMQELLENTLKKNGICATVEPNHVVTLEHVAKTLPLDTKYKYPLLDGQSLTSYELQQVIQCNGSTKLLKQEIKNFLQRRAQKLGLTTVSENALYSNLSSIDKQWIDKQNNLKNFVEKAGLYTVWWQLIPSVGMRLAEPFYPICYPFIPHLFSLWDLAPSLGKNSSIHFIDTGIAAFLFDQSVYKNSFKKNQNVEMNVNFKDTKDGRYNFVDTTLDILNKDIKNKQFVSLGAPNNQSDVLFDTIPVAFIADKTMYSIDQKVATFTSGHGTHTACIACGKIIPKSLMQSHGKTFQEILSGCSGICGIAPAAQSIMLKVFASTTHTSTLSVIMQALEKAVHDKAKIVNASMKIADFVDHTQSSIQKTEQLLAQIPYVVAATGNATSQYVAKNQEAYPASSYHVTFDVGAFSLYQDKKGDYYCPIPEWSRYQHDSGPKFVEPGQNILSAGLIPQQVMDSMYVFMQGTSAATAFISGFLALLLSEFSGVFTNERTIFLTVCYASGIYMHDDQTWKTKTIFGTLDFRLALFTCHVLAALQKQGVFLEKDLHKLIALIHLVIFSFVDQYAKEQKIITSFRNNFMHYFNQMKKQKEGGLLKIIKEECVSVEQAVNLVSVCVQDLKNNIKNKYITSALQNDASLLLEKTSFSLFENLPQKVQDRILFALKN